MVGSLSNINTGSKTMRHGEVSERCETGLPRLYQYPHNTLYITKWFMQLFLIIPLSSLSNIVCNLINCGVTCRREIMHVCSGCKKVYHKHIKLPRWMSGCGIW